MSLVKLFDAFSPAPAAYLVPYCACLWVLCGIGMGWSDGVRVFEGEVFIEVNGVIMELLV